MNVGELKAILDDYGDHLEVVVDNEDGEFYSIREVWDTSKPSVVIEMGEKKEEP